MTTTAASAPTAPPPENAFQTAQTQLRSVAALMNIDPGLTEVLASPRR